VDGFLSFVWFVAQSAVTQNRAPSLEAVLEAVRTTLAWQQMDEEERQLLSDATASAYEAFDRHDSAQRARWSRTGTSLPTARTLDQVAEDVLARCIGVTSIVTLAEALELIVDGDSLDTMLGVAENQKRAFKPYRSAPKDIQLDVDIRSLLFDWMNGVELQELAERYLSDVTEESYQYEQLAEFSASVFEHHLPWTIGIILQWVNARLEDAGLDQRIPDHLPGAVHHGVSSEAALSLMAASVRSRRLANVISAQFPSPPSDIEVGEALREWLGSQTLDEWRSSFEASPTEIADLLAYVRSPGTQLVSNLFEGRPIELLIDPATLFNDTAGPAAFSRPSTHPSAPIEVRSDGGAIVGTVKPVDHSDVALLTSMGVPLDVHVEPRGDDSVIVIQLSGEPDSD